MAVDDIDALIQRVEDAQEAADVDIERLSYWLGAAQDIRRGFQAIDAAIFAPEARMSADRSVAASYIRRSAIEPTEELLTSVEVVDLVDSRLAAIHNEGVTALRLTLEAFSALAEAFEHSDTALLEKHDGYVSKKRPIGRAGSEA